MRRKDKDDRVCPHGPAAHRPLSFIMRARLTTYQASSDCWRERNHQPRTEPASINGVSD